MDRLGDLNESAFVPAALTLERLSTPLGEMLIVAEGDTVRAIDFADCADRLRGMLRRHAPECDLAALPLHRCPSRIARCLGAYFTGDLRAIDGIALRTAGTAFQRGVWAALRTLPPGHAASYGQLARHLGRSGAARAVGAANAANPVSIVIPCHRLTGATCGALHGYAGGLERKAWLLHHEASSC